MTTEAFSIGLDTLAPELVKGFGILRRAIARRPDGTGRQETLWGIDDVLDEALAVLAGEGESILARAKSAVNSLLSRPSLFGKAQPGAWIATRGAQENLKAAVIALLRGESDATYAKAAIELYCSFDGDFEEAAPSGEDAYIAALDYLHRSIKRDLTVGDRMVLNTVAGLHDKLDKQSADTSDIIDDRIADETIRLRHRRFFRTSNTQEGARQLAQMLTEGRLRGGSPPARASALAWCARFLCYSDPGLAADYLAAARQLGGDTLEIYRVADAFLVSNDQWEAALARLNIGASPLQTTTALQILRKALSPEDCLARAEAAAIDFASLDPDGRFVLLTLLIETGDWEKVIALVAQLDDEDFATSPVLLWTAATALVAAPLAPDLRPMVLQDIPQNAANFRLREGEAALAARQRARSLMQTAADICGKLGLPIEAAIAQRYELWLALHDPEQKEDALAELRRRTETPAMTVTYIPLALDYEIGMARAQAEQAINQQISRGAGARHLLANAVLALILHGTNDEPEATLIRLERHRSLLTQFFEPANLVGLETHLLIETDRKDEARERLLAVDPGLIPEPIRTRLLQRLDSDNEELPIEELERLFDETGSTTALAQLVHLYGAKGYSDRFLELARKLIEISGTIKDALPIVSLLSRHGRSAEALEMLDLLGDVALQSDELQEHRGWSLFKLGRFNEVEAVLAGLEAKRDAANDRALRFQLLVASGRWAELNAFVDSQWAKREERTPIELAQCATLAAQAGSKWTRNFIMTAVERAPEDPEVLVAAYSAATSAGLEDEIEEAGSWIIRAAERSGDGGPIQSMSLAEIVEQQPAWNERVERANQAHAAGSAPVDTVAAMLRRTWLELQLIPLLTNPDRRDPRLHSVVPLFGGRRRAEGGLAKGRLALERTAVATLAWRGLLDKTIDSFGGAIIPHGLLVNYFEQLPRIRFHQPSRVTFARALIELLQNETVSAFSSTKVPNPVLEQDIGESLAALLTEAAGEAAGQHVVVHPFPITKAGSLRSETVALDAYHAHLCSCSAVVDALEKTGRLSIAEKERARSYLDRQEQRWPEEPVLARGATLYLSDLSVSYLRHIGVLAKIEAAGLKVIVSKSEIDEARALREWNGKAEAICRLIEDAGATLAKAIEDGRVMVDQDVDDDDEQATAIGSLCAQADYLVCDDRFLNRFEHFEHEGGNTRIISSHDIIEHLAGEGAITAAEATEARTALRRGGAIYMPVTSEELVAALADRHAESEAIVETAELRAIRENIRLAQLLGWFDASADTPWLVNLNVALVDAITEVWSSEIDEADARARSNWLAALTGLRDWANSVVKPGLYHLGGDSIVLDHARFAFAYSSVAASGRDAYERWLERELEWIWEEEPRLKTVLLNHLRGVIRSLDPDLIGADTNVPEGARLRIALRGLPPFLQSLLIDDDDFRKQAELDGGYVVHIGADAEFPRSMFLNAVAAIYAAPNSAVSLTDASGRVWSVTTDTLGEFWPIRLRSDDLKRQTRGILALLPTPETRLRAFDKLVAESGISPSVAADWREELAGAPLDPDRIELLDREIASWPGIVARATAAAMEQEEASISALVPSDQRYYELLAGADAPTLNDYAASLGTRQAHDAPWPFPLAQARAILLLASQSSLIEGRLDYLSAEDWVKLGDWVRSHGDLLARIGFIECSLGHAAANPDLEPILLDLISGIVALDPDDADGHLRFFTSIAMFVEGEVSMRGTLTQRCPFARRIATFAHAALMARLAFSGVERSEFADICTDMRGWRFMVQTLVDLRLEPRWRPEYFSPRQVKNDALGRILNRAGTITEEKLPRAIAKKILGKKDSVLEASTSASVFWPGPIEGALPAVQPMEAPAELLDLLSAEFAEEDLSIGGLSRLVNMEMVFRIPEALLDTIIARLRDVGPKVFAIFPDKLDQPYLVGLGYVAATHRRPELAVHVQRLARYRRNRGMKVSIADEFQLALSAAAAHEDANDWRDFLGQWIFEVAHFVKSADQARQVEAWIEALFDIDSGLRATAGRGLAAIRLLLDK